MLLRQRAGEWTGNMVGASGRDAEEILGPSIGSKWVQHRIPDVIASMWPGSSQGGRIRRLSVASGVTKLFDDGRINVNVLLLKLPELVYWNWAVTLAKTNKACGSRRYASNVRVVYSCGRIAPMKGYFGRFVGLKLDALSE